MSGARTNAALELMGHVHGFAIFSRRVKALATAIDALLPGDATALLDVGCGDGSIGAALAGARRGSLQVQGVEIRVRPGCRVPVLEFDGRRLPFPDRSFDYVLFVDVLHHTLDPAVLLSEARRVARRGILVKDHLRDRPAAAVVLAAMDWIGNRPHGVASPGRYWSSTDWARAYAAAGLVPARQIFRMQIYPAFLRPIFEWGLHHLTLLEPARR